MLKGVENVECGYAGGETDNPTYEDVCTGRTGHAEVVKIAYNKEKISFEDFLSVFWLFVAGCGIRPQSWARI